MRTIALIGLLAVMPFATTQAEEYFERYGLTPASPSVDLGIQPLAYPAAIVASTMRHDRLLKRSLTENKQDIKTHAFLRGADMLALLADQRLEGGVFGDMPTILSSSHGKVWIAGLLAQTSTGVVAKGDTSIQGLVGKRVGYVPASTAYNTLLQGLSSAGLSENQLILVSMRVDEMPEALERGDIDAFAGWDPATSIALRNNQKNHAIFRGQSVDYFVLEREFVKRSPEAARHVVASLVRAVEWLRRSQRNLEKAIRWAMADASAFSNKPESLSVTEIATITRRDLLNIPSAPAIVFNPNQPPLKHQFDFLVKQGKLPATAKWEEIENSFRYDGIAKVLAESRKYQINSFDYED
ncbi:MAG: ABC transporter substrate-binding protein [Rhodoferax sp.]|nr:ABC transporter substrate-binding protein [Rhodoferax sp.]